jgi:hypothetical protein
MALGYAIGSIEEIELVYLGDDVQLYILDGGSFELGLSGSTSRGANGRAFTQLFDRTAINFGLEFTNFPITLLDTVLAAIKARLAVPDTFVVNVHDDRTSINHYCTWDFAAQPFGPVFPKQRTDPTYLQGYTMRLIAVSEVP